MCICPGVNSTAFYSGYVTFQSHCTVKKGYIVTSCGGVRINKVYNRLFLNTDLCYDKHGLGLNLWTLRSYLWCNLTTYFLE
jgi:hypothetical protein